MEALGCASAIVSIADVSLKVFKALNKYQKAVKHAQRDIDRLRDEVEAGKRVCVDVQELLDGPHGSRRAKTRSLQTALETYKAELEDIFGVLQIPDEQTARHRFNPFSRIRTEHLKWPFKDDEFQKALGRLERAKSSISLALQLDQTEQLTKIHGAVDTLVGLKGLSISFNAAYDSHAEEEINSTCLPGTRHDLLRTILQWTQKPFAPPLYWLSGAAGSGKSTIARTVARDCERQGFLAATFFFKRGDGDRGDAKKFFPTLAAEMVRRLPHLSESLRSEIPQDETISNARFQVQFERLILEPLAAASKSTVDIIRLVVVIDALDECDDEGEIGLILRLLPRIQELPSVALKVFLTSRPELPIRHGFALMPEGSHEGYILHEEPEAVTRQDIDLFLRHEIEVMKINHNALRPTIPSEWPSKQDYDLLLNMAVPLFIFASTVCKFIGGPRQNPTRCLQSVLSYRDDKSKHDANDIQRLAPTYLPVLEQLLASPHHLGRDAILHDFTVIVGSIIHFAEPLSVESMRCLLDLEADEVYWMLDQLHSVLSVPEDSTKPVRLLHLSLHDFLVSQNRPGNDPFHIDPSCAHDKITQSCLHRLSRWLRRNVCELPYNTVRSSIGNSILEEKVPCDVRYACQYWTHHLISSNVSVMDGCDIEAFLKDHCLHWFEVLGLLGEFSTAISCLSQLRMITKGSQDAPTLHAFVSDAERFARANQVVIDRAPLQVYHSSVAFAPTESLCCAPDKTLLPKWIEKLPGRSGRWDAGLMSLFMGNYKVRDLAYSPQGYLATANGGSTIMVWDASTGVVRHEIDSVMSDVTGIHFSSTGQLAAAYNDTHIRLWDMTTGFITRVLSGHSKGIDYIQFSTTNPEILVSVSLDETLRVWNTKTGSSSYTYSLTAHLSPVYEFLGVNEPIIFSSSGEMAIVTSEKILHADAVDGSLAFEPREVFAMETYDTAMEAASFLSNGNIVVITTDQVAQVIDRKSGQLLQTSSVFPQPVGPVLVSPRGIVFTAGESVIYAWDTATDSTWETAYSHRRSPRGAFSLSADGAQLALAEGSYILLYDVDEANTKYTLLANPDQSDGSKTKIRVRDGGLLLSPRSSYVASFRDDEHGFEIFETSSQSKIWKSEKPIVMDQGRFACAFSQNETLFASSELPSSQSRISIWQTETGKLVATLSQSIPVHAIAITPDCTKIATVSEESLTIWSIGTGSVIATLQTRSNHVVSLDFNATSTLLAFASHSGPAIVWSFSDETLKMESESNLKWGQFTFSPTDPNLIAAYSIALRRICVWDVMTGGRRQELMHTYNTRRFCFSNDGHFINTPDGSERVYDTIPRATRYERPGLYLSDRMMWVCQGGVRRLMLPTAYRVMHWTIGSNLMVFGDTHGDVHFLRLNEDEMKAQGDFGWDMICDPASKQCWEETDPNESNVCLGLFFGVPGEWWWQNVKDEELLWSKAPEQTIELHGEGDEGDEAMRTLLQD